MSKINDGGPAFPSEQSEMQNGEWNQTYESGMSLRDYFAAKALNGMLSRPVTANRTSLSFWDRANDAYKYADAMLKARESPDE